MAEPDANDSLRPALLEQLMQLTAEEQGELLKALQEQGSSFSQLNVGGNNFQNSTIESGATSNSAETININNTLQVDIGTLQQVLEQLINQKASISPPYFYPSDLGSSTFVGRGEELGRLRELLDGSERVAIAAATGMGGIGKTELAWQYARQCEQDGSYPAGIWWLGVRGANLSSQVLSYSLRMGLGEPPDALTEEADRVQWCFDRWGEALAGKRLLILDDVVDYQGLRLLLPQDERYQVLLTTRKKLGKPVQRLDLGVLKPDDALELLRQLVEDDQRIDADLETAQALCQWLGFLPLGIELVGRYLARKQDLSFDKLLGQLETKRLQARALRQGPEEMAYQDSVAAAFELSWQALSPAAQELGCRLSLFALAPIPWRLVESCYKPQKKSAIGNLLSRVPMLRRFVKTDGQIYPEDLGRGRDDELLRGSLLERSGYGEYQLHQVIREAFAAKRGRWDGAEAMAQAWTEVLVAEAKQVPPTLTLSVQEKMEAVIPHWEMLAINTPDYCEELDSATWPQTCLGRWYQEQSLWQKAEHWLSQAVKVSKQRFGIEHPSTANSLNNLALLYQLQGRYSEAEPLFERALAIYESQLGPEHPNTATSLNNLAELYRSQGRYSKAVPLYERASAISESQPEPEHSDTAIGLNNLAGLYYLQGRYSEAEPLYERALAISESQLSQEYPSTATSLNNLAGLYRSQSRYSEAEPLLERALAITESQLGPEHPNTATSLNNLAGLYHSQGRYSKAEPLYKRALAIWESKLGSEHPNIAISLNNLAELYKSQFRYSEAKFLQERALAIKESQLGPEHPDIALSLNNLAGLYYRQGLYSEAEPLYERALAIRKSQLGAEHPDTAWSLNNLAGLYDWQARYSEAESFYERALAIKESQLGPEHPDTQTVLRNLIGLVSKAVKDGKAQELSGHPRTQKILERLKQQNR